MNLRRFLIAASVVCLAGCTNLSHKPYQKADEEDARPKNERDSSDDVSFKAFIGTLREAVGKKDMNQIASMMTPDFAYYMGATQNDDRKGPGVFQVLGSKRALAGAGGGGGRAVQAARHVHGGAEGVCRQPGDLSRLPGRNYPHRWRVEVHLLRDQLSAMESSDPLAYGLPHREPFIFIDRVEALSVGERAVCAKTFSGAEDFFRGHFPGNPIVPGVILSEALAQTAGIAAGQPASGRSYLLSAIRQMKFPRAAGPGELITLEARKIAAAGGLLQFEVQATIPAGVAATGVIVLSEAG
ncbi:MAG: 3-hydroxyacyl-ACP dehydratase FabZ family protein [Chthoniobacteraceae bacterium]